VYERRTPSLSPEAFQTQAVGPMEGFMGDLVPYTQSRPREGFGPIGCLIIYLNTQPRSREYKMANLRKEIDRIQAKEGKADGLTEGQAAAIVRNEQVGRISCSLDIWIRHQVWSLYVIWHRVQSLNLPSANVTNNVTNMVFNFTPFQSGDRETD